MLNLMIADTAIRQDVEGRFCLNDLHRSSGGNPNHRPGEWLRNKQTKSLIDEIATAGISAVVAREGAAGGTYVTKEMVYAYAMWISPAFHLKVIRAYDAMVTKSQPVVDLSDPATLRAALLGYTEKVLALESRVGELAPKAVALDRIATASGSFCLRDAAKNLQLPEKRLIAFLQQHLWIYRRQGGSTWLAYADRLQKGLMEHKVTTGEKADGTEWTSTQARITARGMAKLSEVMVCEAQAA